MSDAITSTSPQPGAIAPHANDNNNNNNMNNVSLTATNPTDPTKPPRLIDILRTTHRALKAITTQRQALDAQITVARETMNKAQADYFAENARLFEEYVRNGGPNSFDSWRAAFARKECERARECRERMERMRAQIMGWEAELGRLEKEHWERWTKCLERMKKGDAESPEQAVQESPVGEGKGVRFSAKIQVVEKGSNEQQPQIDRPQKTEATAKATARRTSSRQSALRASRDSSQADEETPLPDTSQQLKTKKRARSSNLSEESTPRKKHQSSAPSSIHASPQQTPSDPSYFSGITNPVPGQLYYCYYEHPSKSERGWYAGLILPWDGDTWATSLKFDLSMSRMDLAPDFPACYIPEFTPEAMNTIRAIKGWAPGFEDGGPRVQERTFLVLFFDDRKNRPGNFKIPKRAGGMVKLPDSGNLPVDWVEAKNLRPWGAEMGTSVRGKAVAGKFMTMLRTTRQGSLEPKVMDGDVSGLNADTSASVSSQKQGSDQTSNKLGETQQDMEMPDSDASTIRAASQLFRSTALTGSSSHGFQPTQNKMDVDIQEGYATAPNHNHHGQVSPTASIGYHRRGSSQFLDEGVGMDYDLAADKHAVDWKRHQQLPPILSRPSSEQHRDNDESRRLPSFSEVFPAASSSLSSRGPASIAPMGPIQPGMFAGGGWGSIVSSE